MSAVRTTRAIIDPAAAEAPPHTILYIGRREQLAEKERAREGRMGAVEERAAAAGDGDTRYYAVHFLMHAYRGDPRVL